MVGHDDGAATVATGDHDQQIAFFEPAVLIAGPAAGPGEREIGLPMERQVADDHLAGHARLFRRSAMIFQQVIAQRIEVAAVMLQQRLRHGVGHAVGIVFVQVASVVPAVRWFANRPPRTIGSPCDGT